MKIIFLAVMVFIISGCAASIRSVNSNTCTDDSFVSQNAPHDCKKEVCINGKIASIEDLTETASVDDWAEEKFCLLHPINCYKAYVIRKKVVKWTEDIADEKKYWDRKSLHNGTGDEARHLYAGCLLAEQLGADFARKVLAVHEEDSGYLIFSHKGGTGNPCCEKAMDLYNNEIGISLADKTGTCEEKVLNSLHLARHYSCEEKKESESSSNAK